MRAYLVDATLEHAERIADLMRPDDVREIWAAKKTTPRQAIITSFILSNYPKTIMIDDEPVAMFGVTGESVLSGTGTPWMLGTGEIEKISIRFLRGSKNGIKEILSGYRILENYVDARNTVSIQWLKWLGFDIMAAEPYGAFGLPFHRFYMENK